MPDETFGEVGYTPPTGRFATTDEENAAYLAGDAAGWTHANYAAVTGNAQQSLTNAAADWAGRFYPYGDRVFLRAVEGFTDGAERFDLTIHGD